MAGSKTRERSTTETPMPVPAGPAQTGAPLAGQMQTLAKDFAARAKSLPFVESVWAGYSAGLVEIWTIIQQDDRQGKVDENLRRYLAIAEMESGILRQSLPFSLHFHTTPTGPDLPDYIPKGFVQVA